MQQPDLSSIEWQCLPYEQLTTAQLYDIMRVRQEVFVVEQTCPYLDADGYDDISHHLCGHTAEGELVAYARILPTTPTYPEHSSIGRVLTTMPYRRTGLGRMLMPKAITATQELYPDLDIKIMAQHYLESFYKDFGFETTSERFLYDDIWHIDMVRVNDKS